MGNSCFGVVMCVDNEDPDRFQPFKPTQITKTFQQPFEKVFKCLCEWLVQTVLQQQRAPYNVMNYGTAKESLGAYHYLTIPNRHSGHNPYTFAHCLSHVHCPSLELGFVAGCRVRARVRCCPGARCQGCLVGGSVKIWFWCPFS